MSEKEITGKFQFDQDSKRYHRFKIEAEGVVGNIYIPKSAIGIPKRIVLKNARWTEEK